MKNVIVFGAALAAMIVVGAGFASRIGDGTSRPGRFPSGFVDFKGGGQRIEETRKPGSFSAISLPGSGNVRVRIGGEHSVVVRASERVMRQVETDVRGDELVLNVRGPNFGSSVEYEVTVPTLRAIRVSGSGDLVASDTIAGDSLQVSILGSGSVEANVHVGSLSVNSMGSGDLAFSGDVDAVEIKVHGSGDLAASDLDGRRAVISIAGSGDVDIGEFQELNANVMGSGDVEYEGDPRLTVHTPGSGEVTRR